MRSPLFGKKIVDFPELDAEWDEVKNGRAASAAHACSAVRAFWTCKNGHEFVRSPASRTRTRREEVRGCPLCRKAASKGVRGKTVADYPLLAAEWDPKKNARSAAQVAAGSNKAVWWRCSIGHEFRKSPNGRTNNRRQTGGIGQCPQCYEATITRWSWDTVIEKARRVCEDQGFLPPALWFNSNGLGSLV